MHQSQPIRLPPPEGRPPVGERRDRVGDYTVHEKAAIARMVVTPDVRIECPRCDDHLELTGVPAAGGGTIETVWDFQCPGCHRRVLLTHLPDHIAKASCIQLAG